MWVRIPLVPLLLGIRGMASQAVCKTVDASSILDIPFMVKARHGRGNDLENR